MTLKCVSEFPHPVRPLLIAPQNMSRVFDADNTRPTEPQGGLFAAAPRSCG